MMRLRKTLWLMSASGLVIMSCCPNAQANILPQSSLPDAVTSVYTHFTHTSHPKETLLSSAFYPLPENSGRVRAVPAMNSPTPTVMIMTAAYLPEAAMTMTSTMPNVAARKDIPRHPVRKGRKVPTSVLMIMVISKNVSLLVPQIMSPAKSLITALARLVTANMPLVKKIPNAPVRN